nr:MAG TPA: hypothetical protein [Caudoviricetes sp.]
MEDWRQHADCQGDCRKRHRQSVLRGNRDEVLTPWRQIVTDYLMACCPM